MTNYRTTEKLNIQNSLRKTIILTGTQKPFRVNQGARGHWLAISVLNPCPRTEMLPRNVWQNTADIKFFRSTKQNKRPELCRLSVIQQFAVILPIKKFPAFTNYSPCHCLHSRITADSILSQLNLSHVIDLFFKSIVLYLLPEITNLKKLKNNYLHKFVFDKYKISHLEACKCSSGRVSVYVKDSGCLKNGLDCWPSDACVCVEPRHEIVADMLNLWNAANCRTLHFIRATFRTCQQAFSSH